MSVLVFARLRLGVWVVGYLGRWFMGWLVSWGGVCRIVGIRVLCGECGIEYNISGVNRGMCYGC